MQTKYLNDYEVYNAYFVLSADTYYDKELKSLNKTHSQR